MPVFFYKFSNKIRLQKQGGPIGLRLTGEIADCLMIDWDMKLLAELESHNIVPELYTRFKDDIAVVVESLEKGSTLEEGKIVVDDRKIQEDKNRNDTEITMDIIQELANSINPKIKLTVETPCNYPDGKLPVLDITIRVNKEAENRLDFEFYEKPTKYPRVILADSALSFRQKRTILTQEGLRRLRNTKIELGPTIQKKHLNQFMVKVKNSGYDAKFRMEILKSILKAFDKMVEDDENDVKPLYRCKDWNAEERALLKAKKKFNWWNTDKSKIQFKSVLFVTPTPGGVLLKALQKREEELNKNDDERVKMVEKGGIKMKDMLGSKDPFEKSNCSEKSCPLCTKSDLIDINSDDIKIQCNTNNVGYRWVCQTCKDRNKNKYYEGETGRSARIRGAEHLKDFEKNREKSVLLKHKLTDHPHENFKYKMEITKKFRDSLTRQANEAVRIFSRPPNEILNSKSKFNHPPLARVVVEKRKWKKV